MSPAKAQRRKEENMNSNFTLRLCAFAGDFPVRQRRVAILLLVTMLCLPLKVATSAPIDDLQKSFASPPDDTRIMMRWWWFGPTVEKSQIERELRLMKEGGIGGFEVQPVYALILDESSGTKTLPYLSDEFIEALRFTAAKARELGLRFDLTLGSGWPFGGPTVKIDHAAARLRFERSKVDGSSPAVKVPAVGVGEKLLAVFLARVDGTSFASDSVRDRKSTRLNSSHSQISYAVF